MVNFTITVVRHGITDANQNGTIQGQLDEPLNDLGRHQASMLGKLFNGQTLSHVFSSDLCRAKETADLILNNFLIRPAVILDQRLRERNYGSLQGQPVTLLRDLATESNKNVLDYTADGGEPLQQLSARAVSFFTDLCSSLSQQFPVRSAPPTPRLLTLGSSQRNSRASVTFGVGGVADSQQDYDADSSSSNLDPISSSGKIRKFYLDEACPSSGEVYSSQDSGISGVFSSEPLTVETNSVDCLASSTNAVAINESSTVEALSNYPASPTPLEWPPLRSWYQPTKLGSNNRCGARKVSMQSIASDDSNFPEIDAQVLVVSHGGTIRELLRYFVDDLSATAVPGGKGAALRPCPNTGFSTFFVSIENGNDVCVTCLNLHSKDHLLYGSAAFEGVTDLNAPIGNEPV